jgi:hypothetical protein
MSFSSPSAFPAMWLLALLLLSSSSFNKTLSLNTGSRWDCRFVSRRAFGVAIASTATTVLTAGTPAVRAVEKLSDAEVAKIVQSDLLDRQFLVTGDITRSIYQPTATFTDEIDTYSLDQWVKGTQRLFVGKKSDVRLVGDISVTPQQVEFRFDEDLAFNIPFQPVVSLSGKVVLKRDLDTGYITSYREFWDQDVATVLKSAKF